MKVLNALSLNMYDGDKLVPLTYKVSIERIKELRLIDKGIESCVGHQTTADVLTSMLGVKVDCNRCTVYLGESDRALVAQYRGPRLPEGATTLPEGATIDLYLVKMISRENAEKYLLIS